ncbi:helix-turn-helix transcriptional regulator [Rosenbergiella australiborealis]|uniref:helix-turn-helix transcriptional regulator n=1 Tax=Rosenbergiella australiborealis TaxID=1544696 RepID=UPI001F4DA516|nr:AraC family transcriptional regulator [Rosenbergiella australiborealis]
MPEFNLVALLEQLVNQQSTINVYFPAHSPPTDSLALRVPFPRLEIVLDGTVIDRCLPPDQPRLLSPAILYIPADKWNQPQWEGPATTLSILFSKQKLGFSLQHWDGQTLISQLTHLADTLTKSKALYVAIKDYIDENAFRPLNRDSVAKQFHITPNYLSHLFQKAGSMGFNDYLTAVRLELAKKMLRGYELKIKEIAHQCGFEDSNYFCRLFRKHTARSPSEYRRHCRTR